MSQTTPDRSRLQLNFAPGTSGNAAVTNQPRPNSLFASPGSPVGEGLIGLRYIDEAGSRENLLDGPTSLNAAAGPAGGGVGPLGNGPYQEGTELSVQPSAESQQLLGRPPPAAGLCPPGLECLLDAGQVVVHMGNLRQDVVVFEDVLHRMEVIDETRKVLLHVEQEDLSKEALSDKAFRFRFYNREKLEVAQVYSPHSASCVCCGASWHCCRRCQFQSMVYTPVGTVAGFVRRSHTLFVQEYQILNAQEEPVLTLRGGGQDLEIYSLDLDNELGRMSVHGWSGIMHEIRRTSGDWGLTFPIDLDVRVKVSLIAAVFSINWLLSTKGGKSK